MQFLEDLVIALLLTKHLQRNLKLNNSSYHYVIKKLCKPEADWPVGLFGRMSEGTAA